MTTGPAPGTTTADVHPGGITTLEKEAVQGRPAGDRLSIAVCVKQVLDPEAPVALLEVAPDGRTVHGRGVAPALDPYSMHALLAAVDLREELGGQADITILATGPNPSRNLYLRALAAGGDQAVLLAAPQDPGTFADPAVTSERLRALLRSVHRDRGPGTVVGAHRLDLGPQGAYAQAPELGSAPAFDLVLTGRRAADTNAGAVGPMLAEELGWPIITLATALRLAPGDPHGDSPPDDGRFRSGSPFGIRSVIVDRLGAEGTETVVCPLPAVITVSHEVGEIPTTAFAKIIDAKKKPFRTYAPGDLGLADPPEREAARFMVASLTKANHERSGRRVDSGDARASGRELARLIQAMPPR